MTPSRFTRRALLAFGLFRKLPSPLVGEGPGARGPWHRNRLLGLLLAACLFSAGCKAWDPGFKDEFANWGQKARANSKNPSDAGSLGLSSKSRQIERNLGVQ